MSIFKQLTDKSWATQGVIGAINDRSRGPAPAAKTGLAFFLAVLTSVFGLFVVGYRLRMAEPDWVPITDPGLLWFNSVTCEVRCVSLNIFYVSLREVILNLNFQNRSNEFDFI